jgi:hypothetical protein
MLHTLVHPKQEETRGRRRLQGVDFTTVSALSALRCSNLADFDKVLYGACRALFGWTVEEFSTRWRVRTEDVGYTTRSRICPAVLKLNEAWLRDRDVEALYGSPEYFMNSIAAGISGTTPNNLRQGMRMAYHHLNNPPKRILDFGPGCGLTTIALAKSFPDAEVTWADIPGTNAHKMAQAFAHYAGVTNITWERHGRYDAAFALEVVEHLWDGEVGVGNPFAEPFPSVLESTDLLIYATQWRAELRGYLCPGHFRWYRIDGKLWEVSWSAKMFHNALLARGFEKFDSGWNGQPIAYRRVTG